MDCFTTKTCYQLATMLSITCFSPSQAVQPTTHSHFWGPFVPKCLVPYQHPSCQQVIQSLSKGRTYSKLTCSITNSPSKARKPAQELKLQGRDVLTKTPLLLLLLLRARAQTHTQPALVPSWGWSQNKHQTPLERQIMVEMSHRQGIPKHRKAAQMVSNLTRSELLYKRLNKKMYVHYLPISLSQSANTRTH